MPAVTELFRLEDLLDTPLSRRGAVDLLGTAILLRFEGELDIVPLRERVRLIVDRLRLTVELLNTELLPVTTVLRGTALRPVSLP